MPDGNDHTTHKTSTHSFQGRKNKLSVWMKKIIQPTKDTTTSNNASKIKTSRSTAPSHMIPYANDRNASSSPTLTNTNTNITHRIEQQSTSKNVKTKSKSRRSKAKTYAPLTEASSDSDTATINSSLRPLYPMDNHHNFPKVRTPSATNIIDENLSMKVLWSKEPERIKSDPELDNSSVSPLFSFCSTASIKSSTFSSDIYSLQSTRPTVMSVRTMETNSSTVPIPSASILERARPSTNSTATTTTPSSMSNSIRNTTTATNNNNNASLHTCDSVSTKNSLITLKS
ncbi:hypothetical protein NCAS_0B07940 [Naumovozyma castellii]|uniref:Uncharacterized protein n=1 Tax=Naumovozyma castellii TaxID=27288 RepID=G0VAE8_NAUCA|nr:hypothetical protein NCAS_0B07940 [Naumovozyma castellii CBS 4309]CCC68878.1 hypothetical protein NCAS_0B07940 [Naumovozyma castellii CBS 4309]